MISATTIAGRIEPAAIRIVQQCTAMADAAALLPPNGDESNAKHCPTPPVGWVADEDSALHPPLAHPPAPVGSPHGGSPGARESIRSLSKLQSQHRTSHHSIQKTYNRMQNLRSHRHGNANRPGKHASACRRRDLLSPQSQFGLDPPLYELLSNAPLWQMRRRCCRQTETRAMLSIVLRLRWGGWRMKIALFIRR